MALNLTIGAMILNSAQQGEPLTDWVMIIWRLRHQSPWTGANPF